MRRVSVVMLLLLSCRESIVDCADVTPSLVSQLLNIFIIFDNINYYLNAPDFQANK